MTIQQLFKQATLNTDKQTTENIRWLIKETIQKDVLSWNESQISTEQLSDIQQKIDQLKSGTPLAYVLGFVPFYDCKITVDSRVLIPRPETEMLCELIIQENKSAFLKVLDLCTGSGCISIALAKNLQAPQVTASDISQACLQVATINAQSNNAKVNFIQSNLLDSINDKFDIIVSNPPYLDKVELQLIVPKAVKDYEPNLALYGGEDGLDFYKRIANTAHNNLNPDGLLYLEVGDKQAYKVVELLKENFTDILIIQDYFGFDRFIKARRK